MQEKKDILIIEDEKEVSDLLKDYLENKGFQVTVASDGIKGLKLLKDNLPHLVITDLLLPGEHGIDIVKTVKDKYFIPVIIVSGVYEEEEVRKVMEDYFVEAFMAKPIQLDTLLEKINVLLESKANAAL